MKKIQVVAEFADKFDTSHHYKVGEVIGFDDARAENIVSRFLGVYVQEEPAVPAQGQQQDLFAEEAEEQPASETEEPKDGGESEQPEEQPEDGAQEEPAAEEQTEAPKKGKGRNKSSK